MAPDIFRNALITLYGEQGHVSKFARKTGVRRNTVYRWIREDTIPTWAAIILTLLIREKKRKEELHG